MAGAVEGAGACFDAGGEGEWLAMGAGSNRKQLGAASSVRVAITGGDGEWLGVREAVACVQVRLLCVVAAQRERRRERSGEREGGNGGRGQL